MAYIAKWILTGTFATLGIVAANWYDIRRMIHHRSHHTPKKCRNADINRCIPEESCQGLQ